MKKAGTSQQAAHKAATLKGLEMEIYNSILHFVFYVYSSVYVFALLNDSLSLIYAAALKQDAEGNVTVYHTCIFGALLAAYTL